MTGYVLHYAPDNASLCVRLALEELGTAYRTVLVDRRRQAQRDAAYLRLNPNGLIPVLETPQGPIFETAAILLWLCDRHGALGPAPRDAARPAFLKWLFFLSNTLHPALRRQFSPAVFVGEDIGLQAALRDAGRREILAHLDTLEAASDLPEPLGIFDCYLCPMLRWLALYPADGPREWFGLATYPRLLGRAAALEARDATTVVARAEGLGHKPFTAPRHPTPPEGSAL